ncbi:hypothetical protein J2X65_000335 [Ancylobacter sp. 3268]|uniref:DUF1330 domain-containing protein n=1 Tax=Ancylobacter sp. 3268 TaxID=2817752 RepID=UPI002855F8B1|nr:DUF1330 domain-containing protein [Ancylobacter sp. 3268]MDR6950992.1 hypothetical protein [Ancylobacter sp. 3268]
MPVYLEPTQEAARALFRRGLAGEVVMLNLVRLRAVADYAAHPQLAPPQPVSGAQAYDRYIAHTLPHLTASGGSLLFLGEGGPWLIGPDGARWDRAMLVRQHSVAAFMAFATHEAYLAGLGHRMAAVEDSRLLPLAGLPLPGGDDGARPVRSTRSADRQEDALDPASFHEPFPRERLRPR